MHWQADPRPGYTPWQSLVVKGACSPLHRLLAFLIGETGPTMVSTEPFCQGKRWRVSPSCPCLSLSMVRRGPTQNPLRP